MQPEKIRNVSGTCYSLIEQPGKNIPAIVLDQSGVGSGPDVSFTVGKKTEVYVGSRKIAPGNIVDFISEGDALEVELDGDKVKKIVIRHRS